MDCVTTRLQMEIERFFLSLTLKNAKTLGKWAKFFLVVLEPKIFLGKMTKKRSSEIQKCPYENVKEFFVVRESENVENRWTTTIFIYKDFIWPV